MPRDCAHPGLTLLLPLHQKTRLRLRVFTRVPPIPSLFAVLSTSSVKFAPCYSLKGMAAFLERLSYARSLLVTAPLVFIATGLMGSLSLVSSIFDPSGRIQHGCARLWARMIPVSYTHLRAHET